MEFFWGGFKQSNGNFCNYAILNCWHSEVRLETSLLLLEQKVKKGTNGGVTISGLAAAAAAGCAIGLAFVGVGFVTTNCEACVARRQMLMIPLATFSGLLGSLIDSFLGATLQYSGYCSMHKKVLFILLLVPRPCISVKTCMVLAYKSFYV